MTNATDVLERLRIVLKCLEGRQFNAVTQQFINDMNDMARLGGILEERIELSDHTLVAAAYACQLLESAYQAYIAGDRYMCMLPTLH